VVSNKYQIGFLVDEEKRILENGNNGKLCFNGLVKFHFSIIPIFRFSME